MRTIRFELRPRAPFRLDLTAWAFKRRPADKLYGWDGETFSRGLLLRDTPIAVHVRQSRGGQRPCLEITANLPTGGRIRQEDIEPTVARMLGADVDLTAFYEVAARSGKMKALAEQCRGLHPPCYPSLFECFVNAVACQEVSLHVGLMLLNRTCQTFGAAAPDDLLTFPTAATMSAVSTEELMALAFSRNKANYIREMAQAITGGAADLDSLQALPDEQLLERLLAFKGIGRWSAEYMMLRGYARYAVFPMGDVGARGRLEDFLRLPRKTSVETLQGYVDKWKPYSGLLYFHLLIWGLAKAGQI